MTTIAATTTISVRTYTPYTIIDQGAQNTINYVLWGASGIAVLILFIRLIISIVKRCRTRRRQNLPFFGRSRSCSFQTDPPPNYSQVSIRTLPPSYSQACRMIHYHPSTGNTSQQTTSTSNDYSGNEIYSNESFESDFTVPQLSDARIDDLNEVDNMSTSRANQNGANLQNVSSEPSRQVVDTDSTNSERIESEFTVSTNSEIPQ